MRKTVKNKIVLTGFMGVGKSSIGRHLSTLLRCPHVDLDAFIEYNEGHRIVDIINERGEAAFREIETKNLSRLLNDGSHPIISLGGGTWTVPANRELIRAHGLVSVWLESSFEHCWYNIRSSKRERPLARNKRAAKKLFEERQTDYCLADWHFIIKPEFTSYEIAKQIVEQIFL